MAKSKGKTNTTTKRKSSGIKKKKAQTRAKCHNRSDNFEEGRNPHTGKEFGIFTYAGYNLKVEDQNTGKIYNARVFVSASPKTFQTRIGGEAFLKTTDGPKKYVYNIHNGLSHGDIFIPGNVIVL